MAVRTNTTNEKVDTAYFLNHLLIVSTLSLEILGVAVKDMDVLLRAINVVEEVLSHK